VGAGRSSTGRPRGPDDAGLFFFSTGEGLETGKQEKKKIPTEGFTEENEYGSAVTDDEDGGGAEKGKNSKKKLEASLLCENGLSR